jgi:hypothetical protein
MRRRLAALSLGLLGLALACGAGFWLAARPPVAQYVVPGAADVQVSEAGAGERVISYAAPGERYAWYFVVASGLEVSGWIPPDKWGPADQINTYRRVRPLWGGYAGYVWEQVDLDGGPNVARIRVRRWVTFPWRQYLDYFR